jgi:hypothetical protein
MPLMPAQDHIARVQITVEQRSAKRAKSQQLPTNGGQRTHKASRPPNATSEYRGSVPEPLKQLERPLRADKQLVLVIPRRELADDRVREDGSVEDCDPLEHGSGIGDILPRPPRNRPERFEVEGGLPGPIHISRQELWGSSGNGREQLLVNSQLACSRSNEALHYQRVDAPYAGCVTIVNPEPGDTGGLQTASKHPRLEVQLTRVRVVHAGHHLANSGFDAVPLFHLPNVIGAASPLYPAAACTAVPWQRDDPFALNAASART